MTARAEAVTLMAGCLAERLVVAPRHARYHRDATSDRSDEAKLAQLSLSGRDIRDVWTMARSIVFKNWRTIIEIAEHLNKFGTYAKPRNATSSFAPPMSLIDEHNARLSASLLASLGLA